MTQDYNNGIYPRHLVITDNFDYIKKNYIQPDGTPPEEMTTAIATTYRLNCKNKDRGDIILLTRKDIDINTIAHEALHITRIILENLPCPLTNDTEEAWAYLIGWIASCIENFKNNKIKKK